MSYRKGRRLEKDGDLTRVTFSKRELALVIGALCGELSDEVRLDRVRAGGSPNTTHLMTDRGEVGDIPEAMELGLSIANAIFKNVEDELLQLERMNDRIHESYNRLCADFKRLSNEHDWDAEKAPTIKVGS